MELGGAVASETLEKHLSVQIEFQTLAKHGIVFSQMWQAFRFRNRLSRSSPDPKGESSEMPTMCPRRVSTQTTYQPANVSSKPYMWKTKGHRCHPSVSKTFGTDAQCNLQTVLCREIHEPLSVLHGICRRHWGILSRMNIIARLTMFA